MSVGVVLIIAGILGLIGMIPFLFINPIKDQIELSLLISKALIGPYGMKSNRQELTHDKQTR